MQQAKTECLCCHKEPVVEVMRKDGRGQAARSIVGNTCIQAEAEYDHLLVDGDLMVVPVGNVCKAEEDCSQKPGMRYRNSQNAPSSWEAFFQEGLYQSAKKNFL